MEWVWFGLRMDVAWLADGCGWADGRGVARLMVGV